MMTIFIPGLNVKALFLFFALFISGPVFSQNQKGMVLSSKTNSGIGYVNVIIIGKNIGTVADEAGKFTIALDNNYDKDSLRFSMIGYESKTLLVSQFKEDSTKNIYLNPKVYNLLEVNVISRRAGKPKVIRIGTPVLTDELKSGFENNNLGSELGIKVNVKERVKLLDINLNVATCTFDSVTYRLNIYQVENQTDYKNILNEPIYISFSKDKIKDVITYDLKKYSIIIKGDLLIALELYKDLGEGSLLFRTEFFMGYTYHRKTIEGKWIAAPGEIGMYLKGQVLK